jgi:hypothetical protein
MEESSLYQRLSRMGSAHGGKAAELAKQGAASVVTECGKASFANVRNGLIIGKTGLHEDVFEMRDRDSLRAVGYNLNETLQLEEMLHDEAKVEGHSPEQAACITSFAEELEDVSDPLVESDRVQKEIDLSAFSKAEKDDREQHGLETMPSPETPMRSPPESRR